MKTLRPPHLAAAGLALVAMVGCEKPIPSPPPAVPIAAPGSAEPLAAPNPLLREGIRLEGLTDIRLHTLGDTIVVTARKDPEDDGKIHAYIASGDKLEAEPGYDLAADLATEKLMLVGHLPDRVLALAESSGADGWVSNLIHQTATGWSTPKPLPHVHAIADFAGGFYGYIVTPGSPVHYALARLDVPGPVLLTIPVGEGAICDDFYAHGAKGFEKLAVQPHGIATAAGMLFLIGMGCDKQIAVAAYKDATSAPVLHSIATSTFFDGFAGTLVGNAPDDLWYFRRPMRPMTNATLFHDDGKGFVEIKWPTEDPQAESVAVDESGALWALIDGKLFSKRGRAPFREKRLPERCEPRSLAATKGSVWIACANAVARVSTTKTTDP